MSIDPNMLNWVTGAAIAALIVSVLVMAIHGTYDRRKLRNRDRRSASRHRN